MISHKHKCIFIHIPKVAGTSFEQMFRQDLNFNLEQSRVPLIVITNPDKDNGPRHLAHLTAQEYTNGYYVSKAIFDEYFTFGWVRNPYGRIYSFYTYFCYNYLISFEKFVCLYLKKNLEDTQKHYFYKPMHEYLYEGDNLLVDYVGKLENINEDIQVVFEKANVKNRSLPHKNKSKNIRFKLKVRRVVDILKKHPSILLQITFSKKKKEKAFNDEMKKVIKELYFQDFDSFKYEF